ncbi:MAG: peptidylprolyl isomerase [Candidatus Aenigmarchaeota archaeon]|nr:peptidylprolyl isomerase [Candidatus Aenigmarchaeota archaeon]
MQDGDFVSVDYVGRIKGTNEIFDVTIEDVAKKENAHNPKIKYKPVTLIVGGGFILRGLDEALHDMKVGERKTFEVAPEKAFGERRDDLIKPIPAARFKEQNIEPYPGAVVSIGEMRGRIMSVDGGRVKVDFNHPLAGKTLVYDLEVKSLVEKPEERVKSLVFYFTGMDEVDVKVVDKTADISILKDVDVVRPVKSMVAENVMKWCGVDKARFIETFEHKDEK